MVMLCVARWTSRRARSPTRRATYRDDDNNNNNNDDNNNNNNNDNNNNNINIHMYIYKTYICIYALIMLAFDMIINKHIFCML